MLEYQLKPGDRYRLNGGWMTGCGPFLTSFGAFLCVGVAVPVGLMCIEFVRPLGVLLAFGSGAYVLSLVWAIVGPLVLRHRLPPIASVRTLQVFKKAGSASNRPPRRLCVIVNPFGGGGRAMNVLENECLPVFRRNNIQVTVEKTQHVGHAYELAKVLPLDQFDGLVMVGGDGTFHEIVNGLLARPAGDPGRSCPLGIVAGGSGCSIAYDLNCLDARLACERVCRGQVRPVDCNEVVFESYGKMAAIHSINTFGIGIMGDSAVYADDIRCLGGRRYDVVGTWMLLKRRPFRLTVVADQREVFSGRAIGAFVNNTQHFGQGFKPFPEGQIDDGRLDYAILTDELSTCSALGIMGFLLRTGQHTNASHVIMGQAKQVRFETDRPGVSNFDGELYPFGKTITIKCKAGAYNIFAPNDVGVNGQ